MLQKPAVCLPTIDLSAFEGIRDCRCSLHNAFHRPPLCQPDCSHYSCCSFASISKMERAPGQGSSFIIAWEWQAHNSSSDIILSFCILLTCLWRSTKTKRSFINTLRCLPASWNIINLTMVPGHYKRKMKYNVALCKQSFLGIAHHLLAAGGV